MAKVVHISEAASLAVHSMALVARSTEMLNVNQIADLTNSSRNHLAKVMQTLVKNNYLDSVRGPKGGFTMKGDPAKINLLEIYVFLVVWPINSRENLLIISNQPLCHN